MSKQKQRAMKELPLVAIDMGSDGIRAMAAVYTDEGRLRIMGAEVDRCKPYMERGIINNSANAGFMIKEVLTWLANRIHQDDLPSSFVSLGGRSMQIVDVKSHRDQVRKREVTKQLLANMEAECITKIEANNPTAVVLELIPFYYKLDGVEQDSQPTPDQRAIDVEVHYVAFVGKKELMQKLTDSFKRTTICLEHSFVRPDTLLQALATEDDMRQGCAIIDMGAETTTLSIFKGTQYVLTRVIPLGGHDITSDIEQQGMNRAYAEKLKCEYGFASPDMVETNLRFRIPTQAVPGGELVLMSDELAAIIATRLDQTINPIMDTINEQTAHVAVVYITGGASMLRGMDRYLQTKTNIPVLYGSHAEWLTDDTPDEYCKPVYSALVGTLLLGSTYREEHKNDLLRKKPKLNERIVDVVLDLFGDKDAY